MNAPSTFVINDHFPKLISHKRKYQASRQLKIVKYCNENTETMIHAQSCRFMLVDKRIVSKSCRRTCLCRSKRKFRLSRVELIVQLMFSCISRIFIW
jgi:hypothetical protein